VSNNNNNNNNNNNTGHDFQIQENKNLVYQRKDGQANAYEDGRTMKWLT
jgi:hypothetical protein